MKRLAILMLVAIVLVGCGRETEKIDMEATGAKDVAQVIKLAWHKVTQDDGTICPLSTDTQAQVELAAEELRSTLAPNGVDVVVETLTPEKVEGQECLCNRVLVQGRFVDEWLGAEIARTPCSGCPNQAGCATGSGSGRACGGQTALIYQGRAHDIVPANLIVMAGMIAAADLTGETITYGGCPGNCAGPADCKCGRCQTGCRLGTVNAVATGCEG
jgi:hypothetical protein